MPSPVLPISSPTMPELIGPSSQSSAPGLFRQVLGSAIGDVENSRNTAASAVEQLLSGENQELHTAALAVGRAEITLELFLQVRNKVVQAYQEIMRIQM